MPLHSAGAVLLFGVILIVLMKVVHFGVKRLR